MKYLACLFFLTALLPVRAQEKSAQSSSPTAERSEQKQPAPKLQPAPSPTNINAVNEQAGSQEQNGTKRHSESYLYRLFAPENLPNIGLFLAGVIGIWVAIRTLRAIERQTGVLADSQRPRIVASAHGNPLQTLADEHARRVELEIINKGPMAATNYTYESWIEVLPDTSGDFTPAADHFKKDVVSVLYPDTPQAINIPLRGGISPEDYQEVRRLRKHVCVRLYVEYADPFVVNRRCYANFGFHVLPKGLGFLDKHNGIGYEDKKA
jgi:hypothetical protein